MNRRQWLTIIAISFFALLAGVLSSRWINQPQLASELAIQHFLSHDWQDPDGKPVSSADWQGKLLVVNFWASWCPPCVEEMPALSRFKRSLSNKMSYLSASASIHPLIFANFLKRPQLLIRLLSVEWMAAISAKKWARLKEPFPLRL